MNWYNYVNENPSALLSEKKTRSLLRDAFKNEELKVNLMMNVYNIGFINEIVETFPITENMINRWTKKIVDDFGINIQDAQWAINIWISSIKSHTIEHILLARKIQNIDDEEERKRREEEEKRKAFQEQQKREAEKLELEEKLLKIREDYNNYYVNPYLKTEKERIFVPCGFGKGDNGFFIYGIEQSAFCKDKNANVYALIYNYLIRSSNISDNNISNYFKDKSYVYRPDYKAIYRITFTLLLLMRHNYSKNGILFIDYRDDESNLKSAVNLINHYAALFSRLIGVDEVKLIVKNEKSKGVSFSLTEKCKIEIKDNTEFVSNARELWYGTKIHYHLDKNNYNDLIYILHEISNFDDFKIGQFSALCDMLNCNRHTVCIMPTGSGKSLIYYFASLLQPLPMFIVSPTDVLIHDQIRNLKTYYSFDNVAHLKLTEENSFANWEICNSLNYITPMDFQNRHLLVKFRNINQGIKYINMRDTKVANGASASYIVLDEIHCLSNWGHDFRPEYLMLSKYLNEFLDNITFLGFTATANYTVVKDIQKQLNIPEQNFFSPVAYDNFNVSYDFRSLSSEEDMYHEISVIAATLLSKNERTIIFTKNDKISRKVADAIGDETDVFEKTNLKSYQHFAQGDSKMLVASDQLGIGVNLPNVKNIIHFGLPLSKNEFVQEIGRAGRANEEVKSYVLFLENNTNNVPDGLLMRNTPISSLPLLIKDYDNDYTNVYKKISNGAVSDKILYNNLIKYKNTINPDASHSRFINYSYDQLNNIKQYLYMLYLVGYVKDWYTYKKLEDNNGVELCIVPNGKDLNDFKEKLREYFIFMGNDRSSIAKIDKTDSLDSLIMIYIKWYYEKYLYHHNEQFIDFFEFIIDNLSSDSYKITNEIKDFFILPFTKLKDEEAIYTALSVEEIVNKTSKKISKNEIVNLERINSSRYSYKIDLALFCALLRTNSYFDSSRLERIIKNLSTKERNNICKALIDIYPFCHDDTKLNLLNYVGKNYQLFSISYSEFFDKIYKKNKKDKVYYGIMFSYVNKSFEKLRINNDK